jgi:enoyl-CoA hydratase
MNSDTVLYQKRGAASVLTLNRPAKLNAITKAMIGEIHRALDAVQADEDVRAVVVHGAGRAFCAGFDLESAETGRDVAGLRQELQDDLNAIMRFWHCPKPTIAAVHGYCLGGGLELALACDITIAAEDARFGEPEPRFGSGIVALLLPWITGPKQAKELLLTGTDRVSAGRACKIGLVNRVVPVGQHLDAALAMARDTALLDSVAVKLTKQAINRSYDIMGMRQALLQALEIDVVIESIETPESREFKRILDAEGLKSALAWREARFARD